MQDADLATQESVLRGKELNLKMIRAVSSLMLIISVLTTGVWLFEIITLVYGDPFDSNQKAFEQVGNNRFFTLALTYVTGFFAVFQLLGLLVYICIPKREMSKKDLDLLYLNPSTPKNLRITICLCVFMCEFFNILAQTWLYIDIDFLKISQVGLKLNIRYEVTMLFGVSVVGSLFHIFTTPISFMAISNLQKMVDF